MNLQTVENYTLKPTQNVASHLIFYSKRMAELRGFSVFISENRPRIDGLSGLNWKTFGGAKWA